MLRVPRNASGMYSIGRYATNLLPCFYRCRPRPSQLIQIAMVGHLFFDVPNDSVIAIRLHVSIPVIEVGELIIIFLIMHIAIAFQILTNPELNEIFVAVRLGITVSFSLS